MDGAEDANRLPSDPDWDVIENPGIHWGGPIKEQGGAWEDFLEKSDDLGIRSPDAFKTFDFWDPDKGLATSAKTLDTRALGYVERPARIFNKLKQYIDQIDGFKKDEVNNFYIDEGMIQSRGLELAIPDSTTAEQLTQIQRAIDYAESLGIELNVRRIQ